LSLGCANERRHGRHCEEDTKGFHRAQEIRHFIAVGQRPLVTFLSHTDEL
jgi:hypothetical protein